MDRFDDFYGEPNYGRILLRCLLGASILFYFGMQETPIDTEKNYMQPGYCGVSAPCPEQFVCNMETKRCESLVQKGL